MIGHLIPDRGPASEHSVAVLPVQEDLSGFREPSSSVSSSGTRATGEFRYVCDIPAVG